MEKGRPEPIPHPTLYPPPIATAGETLVWMVGFSWVANWKSANEMKSVQETWEKKALLLSSANEQFDRGPFPLRRGFENLRTPTPLGCGGGAAALGFEHQCYWSN